MHRFAPLLLIGCTPRVDFGDLDAFSSELPLVVIDTLGEDVDADELWDDDGSRAWAPVMARFVDLDSDGLARLEGPTDYHGRGGLHVRGNSSVEYDKKSYAFETWDDADKDRDVALLGLPAEEDWVLQGPYSDKSLVRNELAYTWSNRIGRYAARTRHVELFLVPDNAELSWDHYRGVYVLMEKIKRDGERVDITKLEPGDNDEPAISGGYLLKVDWVEWEEEHWQQPVVQTEACGCALLLEDPKQDEITAEQLDWITAWMNDMEAALLGGGFADPEQGYAAWLEVDSFVDYLLIHELARNVDAYVLSTWLQKDREGKLAMGPVWDFNGSMGNADYFDAELTRGWHYDNDEFPADNAWAWCWWERLLEDPAFVERLALRWAELRADALSDDAIRADIAERAALLTAPAERNFERWPVLGEYVWPNDEGCEDRESWQQELDYLEGWLLERAAWMDSEL